MATRVIHDFEIKSRLTDQDGETLTRLALRLDKPLAVLTREALHAFAVKIRAAETQMEVSGRASNVLLFNKTAA